MRRERKLQEDGKLSDCASRKGLGMSTASLPETQTGSVQSDQDKNAQVSTRIATNP